MQDQALAAAPVCIGEKHPPSHAIECLVHLTVFFSPFWVHGDETSHILDKGGREQPLVYVGGHANKTYQ